MPKIYRTIILTFVLYLCQVIPLFSKYQFLGNMVGYEKIPSGITLFCEDEIQVQIKFLRPNMFRVLLVRPGFVEPLLEYPLLETRWPEVNLQYEERETDFLLSSTTLDLVIQKTPCRLTVLDKQGNIINQDGPGMGMGWDGPEVRCWKTITSEEKFFGLGEKTGNLNKRGRQWVMWNSDFPGYTNQTDPLYQSIPFFIGLRNDKAYGIYFNNSYRTTFNMGAGNLRYFSFAADQGNLDYFFIFGPKTSQVVETYTELTGRISLPPLWALGYQQSRWSYFPDSEVLRLARTFRDKRIPADVIYLDVHYMDGYRVFTWNPNRFPDPAGMLKSLEEMGFKVVVIIDPGVKADSTFWVAREGIAQDHFLKYPDGETYLGKVWPGPSFFPDFSRSRTRDWWGGLLAGLLKIGVKGIGNDMNEPSVWGKAFPLEVIFDDEGSLSSQKKMHNLYGLLMARTTYEAFRRHRPQMRPFVLTRAGFAGEQRYTAVWTGDNAAAGDQLELGIRMMLGLGLSGVPFVGTDVGGFLGTPSQELFVRWIQVGSFSPLFRTHTYYGSNDQEPWSFGEDMEMVIRKYITLRYQFLPYLYNLFWEASESGMPILRPLFWNDQTDPRTYQNQFQHQFFVGDNLLIAPVTREHQYLKKVYLPQGKWLDFHTERVYEGPTSIVVDAPLDRLPMFLRQGAIIPMRDPVLFVEEKPIQRLILEIFPASEYGNFLLYEDDGQTMDYLREKYRLTEFEYMNSRGKLTFTRHRLQDQYRPPDRNLEIHFHAIEKSPRLVRLGKINLSWMLPETGNQGYYYDSKKKILVVMIKEKGLLQQLTLRF